jgi:hypothetical protein
MQTNGSGLCVYLIALARSTKRSPNVNVIPLLAEEVFAV